MKKKDKRVKAIRATVRKVDESRAGWWEWHYERRAKVKALTDGERRGMLAIASRLPMPTMTIYGGALFDPLDRSAYKEIARNGYDIELVNVWYLTSQGWEIFLKLWDMLPEVTDVIDFSTTPCVEIGNFSTLYTMGADSIVGNTGIDPDGG